MSESDSGTAPVEMPARSRVAAARVSTGSQDSTSSSAGSDFSVSADRMMSGIASVSFHRPIFLSPTIWPMRSTRVRAPASLAALRAICSLTSLERA